MEHRAKLGTDRLIEAARESGLGVIGELGLGSSPGGV